MTEPQQPRPTTPTGPEDATPDAAKQAADREAGRGSESKDRAEETRRTGTEGQTDDADAPGMGVLHPEQGWPEPNEPA